MKRNPAALPSPWTAWADTKHPPEPEPKPDKPAPEWSGKSIRDYREMLDSFQGVRFAAGSFDKRFIRDMQGLRDEAKLTVKQAHFLEVLFHKYRGQIGRTKHDKLCGICKGKKP